MEQTATKTEIIEFIDKVKAKAVKAVMDKYNALEEKEIKEFLAQPEKMLMAAFFKDYATMIRKLTDVETEVRKLFKKAFPNKFFYSALTDTYSLQRQFFEMNCLPEAAAVRAVQVERDRAVATVTQEYGKVKDRLNQNQTNLQRIKYLEALGFDCSTLKARKEQPAPEINIAALFPCGDNK